MNKKLLLLWNFLLVVLGYVSTVFTIFQVSDKILRIKEGNILFLKCRRGQKRKKTVEESIFQFQTSQDITSKSIFLMKILLPLLMLFQYVLLLPAEILLLPTLTTSLALFTLGFTASLDSKIEGFSPLKMLQNGPKLYFGQATLVEHCLDFSLSPIGKFLNLTCNTIANLLAIAPITYLLLYIFQITALFLPLNFRTGCYLSLKHSTILADKLYNCIFLLIFDKNTVFFKKIQLAFEQIQKEKLTSSKNVKIKHLCDEILYNYVQHLISLFDELCNGIIYSTFNVEYTDPQFLKCHKVDRELKETKRFIMQVCTPGEISDKFKNIVGDEFFSFEISKPDFGFDVVPDLFERSKNKVPAITKSIAPPAPEEYKINILRILDEPRLKVLKTAKLFSNDIKVNIAGTSNFFIQAPVEILSQAEVIEEVFPVEVVEEIPKNVIRISNGFSSKPWGKVKNITPRFFK